MALDVGKDRRVKGGRPSEEVLLISQLLGQAVVGAIEPLEDLRRENKKDDCVVVCQRMEKEGCWLLAHEGKISSVLLTCSSVDMPAALALARASFLSFQGNT